MKLPRALRDAMLRDVRRQRRDLIDAMCPRLATLEAFSAHRREQLRQYGEVVEDLQTTVRALQTQLEHLQRTVPGRCQGCGRMTDSPDVFYCSDTCTTKVAS